MTNIFEANDDNFEEKAVEQSKEKPVIVDFYADWCMPCKQLSPALEQVAKDYEDKLYLTKVNVDEAGNSASSYGVSSIPTVKLMKDGEILDEFTGAMPEDDIKEWVDKNI
ncbi:MAG: thioredoxin [Candidatus Pacearchaeota archaeon]